MFLTIAKVRYVTARRSVEIENARGGGGGGGDSNIKR